MAKRNNISSFFDAGFLSTKLILDNIVFVGFLGFLTIVYIANAHLAERNVREIQTLQKELKEMRWYYMSLESENMYNAKRSEVAKRVRDNGLRPQSGGLKRIKVKRESHQLANGH
ncbi:FtsL-like putative cell division protein [Phaeodactylibacter luteus]|uniref:FtsL-like putative cell division protein n=1 Tax=Phaeodactylibacter luteus TaxID=1564516 RepID=UPI001B882F69|nr:FtsL-like putative cell division protein [Phaeodactylibacter luteus]